MRRGSGSDFVTNSGGRNLDKVEINHCNLHSFCSEYHDVLEYVFRLKFDSVYRRLNLSTMTYCTLLGMHIRSLTSCL